MLSTSVLRLIILILMIICALLSLAGAPCDAAQRALLADPPGPDVANAILMPRPITPPQALVAAAEALQGTQAAMLRMAEAGYVRTPRYDGVRSVPGRAFVALSYSDPANSEHAPLVMVASDATVSPTRVWIGGGVFTIDPDTGQLAVAVDAPEEHQFIVTGETTSTSRSAGLQTTGRISNMIINYLACSIPGCGAAAGGCAIVSALVGPLAPPAVAGCVLASCGVIAYACLW